MKIVDIIKLLVIIAIIYLLITSFLGQNNTVISENNQKQIQETFKSEPDQELLNYLDNEIYKLKKKS